MLLWKLIQEDAKLQDLLTSLQSWREFKYQISQLELIVEARDLMGKEWVGDMKEKRQKTCL